VTAQTLPQTQTQSASTGVLNQLQTASLMANNALSVMRQEGLEEEGKLSAVGRKLSLESTDDPEIFTLVISSSDLYLDFCHSVRFGFVRSVGANLQGRFDPLHLDTHL